MKKKITINIETERDNEMIKAHIIYSLRGLRIKKEDIKIEEK